MTPTSIVTPHPRLAVSPTDVTHATPQTGASLAPATCTALHSQHSQEKPSNIQDLHPHKPHHSKTVTVQGSPSDSSADSDNDSDPLNY